VISSSFFGPARVLLWLTFQPFFSSLSHFYFFSFQPVAGLFFFSFHSCFFTSGTARASFSLFLLSSQQIKRERERWIGGEKGSGAARSGTWYGSSGEAASLVKTGQRRSWRRPDWRGMADLGPSPSVLFFFSSSFFSFLLSLTHASSFFHDFMSSVFCRNTVAGGEREGRRDSWA
jgi:hypothetical protein